MKKSLILAVVLFYWLLQANAQTAAVRVPVSDKFQEPLVKIGDELTYMRFLLVDPSGLNNLSFTKPTEAITQYGEVAKYGLITFDKNKSVKLVHVETVLKKFHVRKKNRDLRILVNKVLIDYPEYLLADLKQIDKVEITTDRAWNNVEDANTGEQFINIVTKPNKSF